MSIYTYIFPFFLLLFFGGAFLWRKRMVKSSETQYANSASHVVAQRLGMQVVVGDPNLNLVVWENSAPQINDFNPLPHQVFDYRIEMQGTPQGRASRFYFMAKREVSAKLPIVGRTITDTYGCVLEVATQAPLPFFELISVSPNANLQAEPVHASRTDMQRIPGAFRNPTYDSAFTLTTSDPRIVPLLARALPMLSGINWIHLSGQPGSLSVHFPRVAHYTFTSQAELYLQTLLSLAAMAEGRA